MIDKPGCYRISMAEYQADPVVSPSLTRGIIRTLLSECPAKVRYCNPRINPAYQEEEAEEKFDIGIACHSLFLEGVDVAMPIDAKDWRTKEAKEARDTIRSVGKIPLLLHQYNRVLEIVEAAQKQLAQSELGITNLQTQGDSELSYIWQDEATGVWCRCRPDWISKDRSIILDAKFTGQAASPEAFDRTIVPYGYDIQNAFYTEGVQAVEHRSEPTFIFFAIETSPPYLACLHGLSPQYLNMGIEKVRMGKQLWAENLLLNEWPGYDTRVHWIEPKPWALAQWQERQFNSQLNAQEGQSEFPF